MLFNVIICYDSLTIIVKFMEKIEKIAHVTFFMEMLNQFNFFMKDEYFIKFIVTSTPEEIASWNTLMFNAQDVYKKINSQKIEVKDLKNFNDSATLFFDNHGLKKYETQTQEYLKKLMKRFQL